MIFNKLIINILIINNRYNLHEKGKTINEELQEVNRNSNSLFNTSG